MHFGRVESVKTNYCGTVSALGTTNPEGVVTFTATIWLLFVKPTDLIIGTVFIGLLIIVCLRLCSSLDYHSGMQLARQF